MVRFWLGAVLVCAGCAGCGGVAESVAADDLTAVRSSAALDQAELRLEEEGLEDADTAIVAALLAHGLSQPDAQVLDQLGLRAQLLAEVRPSATADQLFASTAEAWGAVAASAPDARVAAVGKLLGFDPRTAAVVISPQQARDAGAHPEQGLDARGRSQLHAWRASVILAISQHLDLSIAQATARAQPLDQLAQDSAAKAALDFAGLPAQGARDPQLAAGRALRFAWRSWSDHAGPDEAWPMVARLLGLEEPPAARAAPPALAVLQSGGLSCAAWATGLQCSGTATGPLTLSLDGTALTVPLARGATAARALDALLSALPGSVSGCLLSASIDGQFAMARLDEAAPPAPDGTEVASVALDTSVWPPVLQGKLARPSYLPRVLVDYSGNELRILVQAVADPSGSAQPPFTLELPVSSRLPRRRYQAQVVEVDGTLRAAATLDRR